MPTAVANAGHRRARVSILLAFCAALLSATGCDRQPPADVSPPASAEAKAVSDVSLLRPADVTIAYKREVARIPRGQTVRYAITVTNASGFPLQAQGEHRAYVAYRWLPEKGQAPLAPGPHRPLQASIAPGASEVVEFDVTAPDAAGQYTLKVFMGVEGGPDFESGGHAVLHYGVAVE